VNVSTIGDLLVDVIVRIDGPIAPDTDTFGEIEIRAGGQAANVAAWVAELEHRARLIAARCADAPGALVEGELRQRGVELVGPQIDGRTGTVVSLARSDGTRSMLTDRGAASAFDSDALDPLWLEGFDWLHVSGYALARDPLRTTSLRAAELASASAARVSVDLASTTVIEMVEAQRFTELLADLRPTVVFATEDERAALCGDTGAEALTSSTWVIKRGAAGGTVVSPDGQSSFDSVPAVAIDPTGAGDAFAAGFLVGGIDTARETAARCVSKNGAMP